jgi:hypothetical protein
LHRHPSLAALEEGDAGDDEDDEADEQQDVEGRDVAHLVDR